MISFKRFLYEAVRIKSEPIKDEDLETIPDTHPIHNWPRDRVIYLSWIESDSPGLGEGSAALEKFVREADEKGLWLVLDVVPPLDSDEVRYEKTRKSLMQWYEKYGFKFINKSETMHRQPRQ